MTNFLIAAATTTTAAALSASLTIVNHTGLNTIRIKELSNKCDGFLVSSDKPIYLKPNESYTIKQTTPVVHTYTICGAGLCSSSAVGMVNDHKDYTLEVTLEGGMLTVNDSPEVFSRTNINCPK